MSHTAHIIKIRTIVEKLWTEVLETEKQHCEYRMRF